MKFYLAAKFERREEMEEKAVELQKRGNEPSCHWVFGGEEGLSLENIAILDLDDVIKADTLILFTHERSNPQKGGGRFVEFGYALALGKKCIAIGPTETVFMEHPLVVRYETWEDFLATETMKYAV